MEIELEEKRLDQQSKHNIYENMCICVGHIDLCGSGDHQTIWVSVTSDLSLFSFLSVSTTIGGTPLLSRPFKQQPHVVQVSGFRF